LHAQYSVTEGCEEENKIYVLANKSDFLLNQPVVQSYYCTDQAKQAVCIQAVITQT
jgi:hypothetical protein